MENKKKSINILDTVNDIITLGKERGVLLQYTDDESYDGRTISINGKKLINFGSCSYLGLETDRRLKDAAIDAINKYGIQYSSSRTYVSCTSYTELEGLMSQVFENEVVLTPTTTLGHLSVIPVVVEEGDVIILDQQAHASIQGAANQMQLKGVVVNIIRHNDMEELEKKIIQYSGNYNKIWYMIDGVYSMYGDYPSFDKLTYLLNKYKSFHLYVDDAHGMSWSGKHGRGVTLSKMDLTEKMIVGSSFAKGFGTGGGVFVFTDKALAQKVRNCGGPLVFSGPSQIPTIAASIASAKIHLSTEITIRQEELKKRIHYCHELLHKHNLPVVSNPDAPVTFVGLGLTKVGYNLVHRLKEDGFFTNLSIFPAVPEVCTGLRFTITLHQTFEDIENLVNKIAYHFPKALADEGRTMKDIYRAFRKVAQFKEIEETVAPTNKAISDNYTVQHETTIRNIDENLWNDLIGNKGSNDWQQLAFFEDTFSGNDLPEHNWSFHYYIIRDKNQKPLLATFFSSTIAKDDMFAPEAVSKQLEQMRKNDKYYLSSKIFTMGCVLSIGDHLWVDRTHKDWKKVVMTLLNKVWEDQEKEEANILCLRDFKAEDKELKEFFMDQGLVTLDFPESHVIDNLTWKNQEGFLDTIKSKKKYYVRKRAFEYEPRFDINRITSATEEQVNHFYQLYKNVCDTKFEIMNFELPKKFFADLITHPQWELLELKLKPEFDTTNEGKALAMAVSYKTKENYTFLVIGLDYRFLEEHQLYPQTLWQTIKRANELGLKTINLGITASLNKRRFGAKVTENVMYVQSKDGFNASVIASMANKEMELVH